MIEPPDILRFQFAGHHGDKHGRIAQVGSDFNARDTDHAIDTRIVELMIDRRGDGSFDNGFDLLNAMAHGVGVLLFGGGLGLVGPGKAGPADSALGPVFRSDWQAEAPGLGGLFFAPCFVPCFAEATQGGEASESQVRGFRGPGVGRRVYFGVIISNRWSVM